MAEQKQVDTIPFDSVVTIEISGGYYTRIVQLLLEMAGSKDIKDLTALMNELKTREPKDDFEYHLITVLTLVSTIEKKAKEQGVITKEAIEIPSDAEETDPES